MTKDRPKIQGGVQVKVELRDAPISEDAARDLWDFHRMLPPVDVRVMVSEVAPCDHGASRRTRRRRS